ncbi:MAG: hypothetical protein IJ666_01000 [Ruminococcus sp.]|nr:hypothetical protein [Ruminococcus sp.]
MNKIKYNEKEEAYEIVYKIWDNDMTVRFYVEEQEDIMENIKNIAGMLDRLNRSKSDIAQLVSDEGYYEGAAEILEKGIILTKAYIDIDEDEVVLCFSVNSNDGYLRLPLALELYDGEFEILGWDNY